MKNRAILAENKFCNYIRSLGFIMEIILRDEVYNLGTEGDQVRVKDGYARNYLIPYGYAFPATSKNAAEIQHKKEVAMAQRKNRIKTEEDLAKALSDVTVEVAAKVGEEEKLFGSVTSQHIAEALKKQNYNIDRRKIQVSDPIKALGEYKIPIRISADTDTEIKLKVVAE